MRPYVRLVGSVFLSLLSLTSCDNGPLGSGDEPGIRLVGGGELTDTIQAVPLQALRVRVVGPEGEPTAGIVVRFEPTIRPGNPAQPTMQVGVLTSGGFSGLAVDTTDSRGEASVRIRLGARAGAGGIVVTAPILGLQDTVGYTIAPGAATRLAAAPEDTTLAIGSAVGLRAALVDRFGNPRSDPVDYSVVSGPVTVDSGARTARVTAEGRAAVEAQAGGLRDTTYLSGVPNGTIAAATVDGGAIVVVNLDGSGYREVHRGPARSPAWAPSGETIVFDQGYQRRLQTLDVASGAIKPLIAANDSSPASHYWPQYGRDGAWVYFHSASSTEVAWRVRSDGTELQRLSLPPQAYWPEGHPSPAPDGRRIAVYGGGRGDVAIHVRDVVTGTRGPSIAAGHAPTWSPVAERIAYNGVESSDAGSLRVVAPDGSGQRIVGPAERLYEFGHRWSPDGRWLIARSRLSGMIELIEVDTGEILPLGFTQALTHPSWRP